MVTIAPQAHGDLAQHTGSAFKALSAINGDPSFSRTTTLHIRALLPSDLPDASAVCLAAFTQAVAPSLSAQGVDTFAKLVTEQALAERMHGDNLLLVCLSDATINGVVELKEGRHVALLFVEPGCQRQGIGQRLMSAALAHARVETVTVNASLPSVPAYRRFGFVQAGEIGEHLGLVYQPMVKSLS